MRGLDNRAAYRHDRRTRACSSTTPAAATRSPATIRACASMILDSAAPFRAPCRRRRLPLRSCADPWRARRTASTPSAKRLRDDRADPMLADRVLIAEPWDIGPGGYQLGNFGEPLPGMERPLPRRRAAVLARRWAGRAISPRGSPARSTSSAGMQRTRSVNFIACHDGFTLADLTAYRHKHNEANGEDNRDGHDENFSWNHGVEGRPTIRQSRRRGPRDIKALLATLFASRGTIMLTAGRRVRAHAEAATTTPMRRTTRRSGSTGRTATASWRLSRFQLGGSAKALRGCFAITARSQAMPADREFPMSSGCRRTGGRLRPATGTMARLLRHGAGDGRCGKPAPCGPVQPQRRNRCIHASGFRRNPLAALPRRRG